MAIYFITPDYTFPSGGVRVIYRHVDILNAHGIEAYVLHRKMGHRCKWFENETRVAYWDGSIQRRVYSRVRKYLGVPQSDRIFLRGAGRDFIDETDVVVLPEISGPGLAQIARGVPKVILNQGCYLTFQGYPLDGAAVSIPYGAADIKGVLINSEDGIRYLRYVFPDLPVSRFHLSIDPGLFAYCGEKKRQVCYSPRKNHGLVRQVVNILRARKALANFELVPFSGVGQQEVARLMQESALFLSFGQYEGFGLPPAEAMACGCVTIGFHAGGGREFMKPEFSFPIEYGDVIGFARAVEEVTTTYDADTERFREMGRRASEFIHSTYSPEREREDLLSFWKALGVS